MEELDRQLFECKQEYLLEQQKQMLLNNKCNILGLNQDIQQIKQELDKRFEKIFEKSKTIIELRIELKQKDIQILQLRNEMNDLLYKYAPKHIIEDKNNFI